MTAPGNPTVLLTLLAAFIACTGYAGGRIHQWYRMGRDRDEAYRDGYDTATRSVFSMAARVISPRRADRSAIRASAAVVIPAGAPRSGLDGSVSVLAAGELAPVASERGGWSGRLRRSGLSGRFGRSEREAVLGRPERDVAPDAADRSKPVDRSEPGGRSERSDSSEPTELSEPSGRFERSERGVVLDHSGRSGPEFVSGRSRRSRAGGSPSPLRAVEETPMPVPLPFSASTLSESVPLESLPLRKSSSLSGAEPLLGASPLLEAEPLLGASSLAETPPLLRASGSSEAAASSPASPLALPGASPLAAPTTAPATASASASEPWRGDSEDGLDAGRGPSQGEDEEPVGRPHLAAVPDPVESSGRHLVPDELVRAATYRLAPDRVARAKVRGALSPEDFPASAEAGPRASVPKPRSS